MCNDLPGVPPPFRAAFIFPCVFFLSAAALPAAAPGAGQTDDGYTDLEEPELDYSNDNTDELEDEADDLWDEADKEKDPQKRAALERDAMDIDLELIWRELEDDSHEDLDVGDDGTYNPSGSGKNTGSPGGNSGQDELRKKLEKSRPMVQKILASDPGNPKANMMAGSLNMLNGRPQAAANNFKTADRTAPGNPKTMAMLSAAQRAAGDKSSALTNARKTLAIDPANKTARNIVAELAPANVGGKTLKIGGFEEKQSASLAMGGPASPFDAQGGGKTPPPAGKDFSAAGPGAAGRQAQPASGGGSYFPPTVGGSNIRSALGSYNIGDFQKAEEGASAAIAAGEDGAQALVLRGKAKEAQGEYKEAINDETAALEREADAAVDAIMERMMSEMEMAEVEEAGKDAEAGLRIAPDDDEVKLLEKFVSEIKDDGTLSSFLPQIRAPGVPEFCKGISAHSLALARQARAKLLIGDAGEALRLCGLSVRNDPANHFGHMICAAAHRVKGDYKEAVRSATTALRLHPLIAEALLTRSLARLKLGEWREAEADASAALRLAPERADGYLQRAQARKMLGDLPGMRADQARARELLAKSGDNPSRRNRIYFFLLTGGGLVLLLAGLSRLARKPPAPKLDTSDWLPGKNDKV